MGLFLCVLVDCCKCENPHCTTLVDGGLTPKQKAATVDCLKSSSFSFYIYFLRRCSPAVQVSSVLSSIIVKYCLMRCLTALMVSSVMLALPCTTKPPYLMLTLRCVPMRLLLHQFWLLVALSSSLSSFIASSLRSMVSACAIKRLLRHRLCLLQC